MTPRSHINRVPKLTINVSGLERSSRSTEPCPPAGAAPDERAPARAVRRWRGEARDSVRGPKIWDRR